MALSFRRADKCDIDALVKLEQASFETDRLSRQRFLHWIKADNCIFTVAHTEDNPLLGYGLVLLRNGTRLARLYSIAIDKKATGQGLGRQLLCQLEQQVVEADRLYMRLEVAANNHAAIALYESNGYRSFGVLANYYDNNIDAVRMQKPVRQLSSLRQFPTYPWYRQTTEFTCGPAALMMAMAYLDDQQPIDQTHELALWREATTIYMMSGHGGSHPYGLALAAHHRHFDVEVMVSQAKDLFLDGVRNAQKQSIMQVVEQEFRRQIEANSITLTTGEPSIDWLRNKIYDGYAVLGLISTYQLTGLKAPHWVCITDIDNECFYLHDPDADVDENPLEFQHIPVANDDFLKMSGYGKRKLRAYITLKKRTSKTG